MLLIHVTSDDSKREGDVERYLALARKHMPLLQYKARRCGVEGVDVDDVVSEGIVAAIVLPSDKPPPPPEDEEAAKAWLVKRSKRPRKVTHRRYGGRRSRPAKNPRP